MHVGIDLGGVVISETLTKADRERLGISFLEIPPVEGVFEAVTQLVVDPKVETVSVISKCKDDSELRLWLDVHDFYDQTGFDQVNLNFCRRHEEKAAIAQRLGVTDFVDNRIEVLACMLPVVPRLYLFSERQSPLVFNGAISVVGWTETLKMILS